MEIEPEAIDGEMSEFLREMDADETIPAGVSQGVLGNMDEYETENEDEPTDIYSEGGMSDVEADADTLASCGWGTDENYGG